MNLDRPGLPRYKGPTKGVFALVHHSVLCEPSNNIMERVKYIKSDKPKHEVDDRLNHLLLLPKKQFPELYGHAYAAWDKADAAWGKACAAWGKAYAAWVKAGAAWGKACAARGKTYAAWSKDYAAWSKTYAAWGKAVSRQKVEAYIRSKIQGCKWNGNEIVFSDNGRRLK